ncbi:uncharacterized protein LOC105447226 [Strongylocentrotus purpuratus]|uniref:Uncharacterized protein n=1 Tax=Strongylocentrotus purpuratus TaxID=7668 RepID=A0A7M7HQI2_STRPU|nr:uncharacterized protein LOC105447226 [Strongylocentrotus purpuratus]|eukprot:XP_011683341.1 PREDICTED: uncharacterized protein LOC105447226 [Strongylocentrotus purpuratus]
MASATAVRSLEPTPLSYYDTRGRVIGEVRSKWDAELTNYQTDFTAKTIVLRQKRPTSSNRKNKPHPKHVAHLRRLTNEPVCTVTTVISQIDPSPSGSLWMQSFMNAQFKLPSTTPGRTTRFGCNKNKHLFASGIVPTHARRTDEKEEPLLPSCAQKSIMMTSSNPFQYVPRKRKITPTILDESIVLEPPPPDKIPLGKPTRWKTSKRLVGSAPAATLQVSNFDGGAPPDYTKTITGRKRFWYPAIAGGIVHIPGYMRHF